MKGKKLSIENIAFGMGGGLLQDCTRDTLSYAMKTSAIKMKGETEWRDVWKDPVHGGKTSKRGRLGVMVQCGIGSCAARTIPLEIVEGQRINKNANLLRPVFRNGVLLIDDTLEEIRKRSTQDVTKQ